MTETKYTALDICRVYKEQLDEAKKKLKESAVYCGDEIKINGLNGWVFEQVVQHHLIEELKKRDLNADIKPQYETIGGKRADLKISNEINKILVEIKVWAIFYKTSDYEKFKANYKEYISTMKEKGYYYLYITLQQYKKSKKANSWPWKEKDKEIFGEENCFFLDDENEDNWQKFVDRVSEILNIKMLTSSPP